MQASTSMTSRLPLLAVLLSTGCFDPKGEEFSTDASTSTTGDGSTSTPPLDTTAGSTEPEPGETTVAVDDTTTPPADTSSSGDDDTTAGPESSDTSGSSGSSGDSTTDPTGEPGCGNGVIEGTELCDDGNATDLDGCTNACTPGSIHVAGNALTYLAEALVALGEAHTSEFLEWPAPDAAGVIVIGHDGASVMAPNYQAHLDAGGHLLLVGGSGDPAYAAWASAFVANTGEGNWHMSDSCASDWNTTGAHPMTALLPATHEFMDQSLSYHMLHFTAMGQPVDTELLGQSCEAGPNNYVLVTRRYASGGTFTYMALDLGPYSDATSGPAFVQPFLQGYLDYVRSPAP
jgi:cysteine-rich repeat protein